MTVTGEGPRGVVLPRAQLFFREDGQEPLARLRSCRPHLVVRGRRPPHALPVHHCIRRPSPVTRHPSLAIYPNLAHRLRSDAATSEPHSECGSDSEGALGPDGVPGPCYRSPRKEQGAPSPDLSATYERAATRLGGFSDGDIAISDGEAQGGARSGEGAERGAMVGGVLDDGAHACRPPLCIGYCCYTLRLAWSLPPLGCFRPLLALLARHHAIASPTACASTPAAAEHGGGRRRASSAGNETDASWPPLATMALRAATDTATRSTDEPSGASSATLFDAIDDRPRVSGALRDSGIGHDPEHTPHTPNTPAVPPPPMPPMPPMPPTLGAGTSSAKADRRQPPIESNARLLDHCGTDLSDGAMEPALMADGDDGLQVRYVRYIRYIRRIRHIRHMLQIHYIRHVRHTHVTRTSHARHTHVARLLHASRTPAAHRWMRTRSTTPTRRASASCGRSARHGCGWPRRMAAGQVGG